MKTVYLAAGAAGMYCGSCLHDNTLAAALHELGEEVLLVPTYTPLRTDEEDVSQPRVFLGGINVFLQQKTALFRHTPWWLDRILGSPRLLAAVARRGVSTRPEKLGDLTVSMLRGETGHQHKEFAKLLYWLRHEIRPDLVHLSNSLLVGLAGPLRNQLGVPVVCSLSGEDTFLEKLGPPHYAEARQLLREQARAVTAFVAMNGYYADFMSDYLDVPREKIEVIPHGLRLEGHAARKQAENDPHFTIGHLARICPDKGLHVLARAIEILVTRHGPLPRQPRLRVAGYLAPSEHSYLDDVRRRFTQAGLGDRFEYVGEPDRAEKIKFLQGLDLFGLPTVYPESKGLPVLEAWANGVPVVVSDHGAFPELIADTGGGVMTPADDPEALALVLAEILRDPQRAAAWGERGEQAVRDRYHATAMAERTRALYRRLHTAA